MGAGKGADAKLMSVMVNFMWHLDGLRVFIYLSNIIMGVSVWLLLDEIDV